ncbi:MAG: C25 family cysteine peptidase [Candidatus Aminicenantes bacterium]|jgi:hypothetical protein
MQTNVLKKKVITVFIFLFIILGTGYFALPDTEKVWTPVMGTEEPAEGEPELNILQSNQSNLDIEMVTKGFYVSQEDKGGGAYRVLQMGKYNGNLNPGYPNLPTLRRYIYIPRGKTARISVNPGSPVTFDNYLVYPAQKPQEDSKDAKDPGFYIDEAVYRSDRFFPSDLVFIEESQNIRSHQVALLHICPFRYNPGRKVLEVYPQIEIKITFASQAQAIDHRLYSAVFNGFVKGFVLNPGALSEYGDVGDNTGEEGAELLIITAPDFLTPANDLHDHKEVLGINTVVKTTNDTGTTKDQIKSYIQNAYDTWSPAPSYVLLLGDVETIPTTYETTSQRGTDLYYSTVDGTDYEPDIFIGRIPVDTLFEAETVIQKIINYESNPPTLSSFYANGQVAAYFQDYYSAFGYEDRRFVRTSEEVRDFLLTRGYNIGRVYCRTENGIDPSNYNNGYYGSGEPLPEELLIANGFAWDGDSGDITTAINSGIFFILHRDHGMDRNDGYTHTGWGDPYFDETHVDALANGSLLPVVMSINCQTGWFDGETDHYTTRSYESFCELFLRKSNGGAVGVFGASRTSYSGYNDFLAEGFIDCVWPDFLVSVPNNSGATSRLGPMLNHGKIAMDILWGDSWGYRQTEYELFHVFGDPSMEMWTREPGTPGTNTVRIQSTPVLGVPITVSLNDINGNKDGNTNFIRTYASGTAVTLTAPPLFNGGDFVKWIKDGVDVANQTVQVTMDEYHSVTAVYSSVYTLTVQSLPVTGIEITVSPVDNGGNGNGITNFTRYYDTDTNVILTAPADYYGRNFAKWHVDGSDYGTPTIQVTMDEDHTAVVEYSVIPGDERIMVIDSDPNHTSGEKIKIAVEANGFNTEYITTFPPVINPQLYPVVFVCLGIYSSNHILSTGEGQVLKNYLDNGGNLYMEGGDTWAYDPLTTVHPYFGIQGVSDGTGDTANVIGITGTFTQGINFAYWAENNYMDRIDPSPGVADAYIIWDNQSPYYHNGVARDTGSYKTIGVSFEFGGIPLAQQTSIMEKYLNFFDTGQPGTITVTSPNGGENWQIGAIYDICWTSSGMVGDVIIDLYQDGVFAANLGTAPVSSGCFSWDISLHLLPDDDYEVCIHQGDVKDYSDGIFTLLAKTPFLSAPDFNRDAQADVIWRYHAQGGYNALWLIGTSNDNATTAHTVEIESIKANMNLNTGGTTVKEKIWETLKTPNIKDGFAGLTNGNQKAISASASLGTDKTKLNQPLNDVIESSVADPRDDPQAVELLTVEDLDWQLCGSGDFNFDGKIDMVWSHVGDGRNCVWYMDGVNFSGYGAFPNGANPDWKLCGVGDFNLDSKPDLLWRNEVDGRNAVWCMDGTTLLSIEIMTTGANLDWKLCGTGDFNDDGKVDLVWRNTSDGRNAVWIMDGVTLASVEFLDPEPELYWEIRGTGDFNGDGKTDLVWSKSSDGHCRTNIWYLDGVTLISVEPLTTVTNIDWKIEN